MLDFLKVFEVAGSYPTIIQHLIIFLLVARIGYGQIKRRECCLGLVLGLVSLAGLPRPILQNLGFLGFF